MNHIPSILSIPLGFMILINTVVDAINEPTLALAASAIIAGVCVAALLPENDEPPRRKERFFHGGFR